MKFEALDSFEITSRGTVFTGIIHEDIPDCREYVGKEITIQEKKYIIKGFEHFSIPGWHHLKQGDNIGILVREESHDKD